MEIFSRQSKITRDKLRKVFVAGIEDGSIRKETDTELSIKYIFKVMSAVIREYINDLSLSDESFYQELDLILCAFRNK
jgi:hypothetical protein